MGNLFFHRRPLQVIGAIVAAILVNMIHRWMVMWIRKECQRNNTMEFDIHGFVKVVDHTTHNVPLSG